MLCRSSSCLDHFRNARSALCRDRETGASLAGKLQKMSRRLLAAALSARWSPPCCSGAALLRGVSTLGGSTCWARAAGGARPSFSSQPEAAVSQDPVEEWRARAEKEARGRPLSKDPSERLSVSSCRHTHTHAYLSSQYCQYQHTCLRK